MDRDFLQAADRDGALFQPAKIECASYAERADDLDIVRGEVAQMVGAEYLAPTDHAPAMRGITAEIAKIAGALQIEMAGRDVWHRKSASYRLPRKHHDALCCRKS